MIGLDWNDLAYRNMLLQAIDSPKAVYTYSLLDHKNSYEACWCIPRDHLIIYHNQYYQLKLVDYGISEVHGGILFKRNPNLSYRSMINDGIMKNCIDQHDKDINDLKISIIETISYQFNTIFPNIFQTIPMKGDHGIIALEKFLKNNPLFSGYIQPKSSKPSPLDEYSLVL